MELKFFTQTMMLFALLMLSACGAKYDFKKAEKLRQEGRFIESTLALEKIYKKHPKSEFAPKACFTIAEIYRADLALYSQAYRYYNEILHKYSDDKVMVEKAKAGLLGSPDYFPLSSGSFWIEGDSASGGKSMRAERSCTKVSNDVFKISYKYYAGKQLVSSLSHSKYYKKSGFELWESDNESFAQYSVILSYPFVEGKTWTTKKGGKKTIFKVISERIAQKVMAESILDCLKISEESPDMAGSRVFNYYAPSIGWVLKTTSAKSGNEHRSSELLSYKIIK